MKKYVQPSITLDLREMDVVSCSPPTDGATGDKYNRSKSGVFSDGFKEG